MSLDNIKQRIINQSKKDNWIEKAIWEKENEEWLDFSFEIAVRIGSRLSENKKQDVYPKTQVELAHAMGCSPQYVNKLLKGQENLQIETIFKIGKILGLKLIEVPKIEINQTISVSNDVVGASNFTTPTISSDTKMDLQNLLHILEKINSLVSAGENNYALAA